MARLKNSASPDLPPSSCRRISASYDLLREMAWSKIVGLEVRPVTELLVDVALERAAIEQVAGDVVEPQALSELVQSLGRV